MVWDRDCPGEGLSESEIIQERYSNIGYWRWVLSQYFININITFGYSTSTIILPLITGRTGRRIDRHTHMQNEQNYQYVVIILVVLLFWRHQSQLNASLSCCCCISSFMMIEVTKASEICIITTVTINIIISSTVIYSWRIGVLYLSLIHEKLTRSERHDFTKKTIWHWTIYMYIY